MALVAHYKLDNNANDSSGNGLHGTANNVAWTAGKIGQCANLTSHIATPVNLLTTLNYNDASLSFGGWFKFNETEVVSKINEMLASSSYTGPTGNLLGYNSYGGLGLVWQSNASANTPSIMAVVRSETGSTKTTSSKTMVYDAWTHYLVVWDKDDDTFSFYADGIKVGNSGVFNARDLVSRVFYINFGGIWGGNGPSGSLPCLVDDVRIYNHALSEKEIQELSKAKILHYKFDDFQEPTENLWTGNLSIYNNYGVPASLTATGETFKGEPVYRLAMTVDDAHSSSLSKFQTSLSSHGVYGGYRTFKANTKYAISIFWKPVNKHDVVFGGTASNISGFYSGPTEYLENGWRRYTRYRNGTVTEDKTDNIHHSFYCPSLRLNETIYIDVCAPQTEEGKDYSTPYVKGVREGIVKDSSGYDNHAPLSLATTPKWVKDSVLGSGAYEFDGSTNFIPIFTTDVALTTYTATGWFYRTDNSGSYGTILGNIAGGSNFEFETLNAGSGTLRLYAYNSSVLSTSYDLNKWNFFALVRDPTNQSLYLNGNLIGTESSVARTIINTLQIGRWNTSQYYKGKVDDVRIYATALSADDVKELYNTRAQIDDKGNLFVNNINQTGHQPLIMDYTTWQDGQTGSVGSFSQYSSRNKRIMATDPWGKETVVWEGESLEGSTAGSGIYYNAFPIDNTKLYRMSWWEKRVTNSTATYAYYYAGLNGYGSTNGVWNLTNETYNTNPYFWSTGYSSLPVGQWFLVVGHVWPYTYTEGTTHPDSGRYFADGTRIGNISTDYRWTPVLTTGRSRTLSIYQPNAGGVIHHTVYPRIDICDGTEPSIAELLSGFDSNYIDFIREKGGTATLPLNVGNQLTYAGEISELGIANGLVAYYPLNGNAKDYTANNNDGTVNGATVASGINGKLCYEFDGTSDNRIVVADNFSLKNNYITVSSWFYPTKGQAYVVAKSNGNTTNKEFTISLSPTNFLSFNLYGEVDNSLYKKLITKTAISLNSWHFVCFSWDGENFKGYIDNLDTSAFNLEVNNSFVERKISTSDLLFGIEKWAGSWASYKLGGKIQNVRIYNRALTAEEIATLYDLEKPNSTPMKLDPNTVYISGEFNETL